jgi:hypothetical protein
VPRNYEGFSEVFPLIFSQGNRWMDLACLSRPHTCIFTEFAAQSQLFMNTMTMLSLLPINIYIITPPLPFAGKEWECSSPGCPPLFDQMCLCLSPIPTRWHRSRTEQ